MLKGNDDMNEIEKYVNRLFRQIPVSKKAKAMKSRLLEEANKKYEKLILSGKTGEDARAAVLSDVGSLDELRSKLPATGALTNIIAVICIILFAVGSGFVYYVKIDSEAFSIMYESASEFITIVLARPFQWVSGGFVILWALARYSRNRESIRLKSLALRTSALSISVLVIALYVIFFCVQAPLGTLSPIADFLWKSGYFFFALPGAALFLGLRR